MRVRARMGEPGEDGLFYAGQSLNDDIYHTLALRRRGGKITAIVDDDEPVVGKDKEERETYYTHTMRLLTD